MAYDEEGWIPKFVDLTQIKTRYPKRDDTFGNEKLWLHIYIKGKMTLA